LLPSSFVADFVGCLLGASATSKGDKGDACAGRRFNNIVGRHAIVVGRNDYSSKRIRERICDDQSVFDGVPASNIAISDVGGGDANRAVYVNFGTVECCV
jgi:hypothetical protein